MDKFSIDDVRDSFAADIARSSMTSFGTFALARRRSMPSSASAWSAAQ